MINIIIAACVAVGIIVAIGIGCVVDIYCLHPED